MMFYLLDGFFQGDWKTVQQKHTWTCHIEDSAIDNSPSHGFQVESELSGHLRLEPRVDIKWCPWRMAKIQGMEAKEVRIKWSLELNQQKSSHLKRNSKPARHFPDRWNLKWFVCEELLSMSLLNLIRILVNLIPSQQISIVGSYVEVWTLRSRRSRKWEI